MSPYHVSCGSILKFEGKVALITGSSGGIGRATALEFAKRGTDIIIQYNANLDAARRVANEAEAFGRQVLLARVDFTNINESTRKVQEMVDAALAKFRKIDFLVNLAGYPAKGEWNKGLLNYKLRIFSNRFMWTCWVHSCVRELWRRTS